MENANNPILAQKPGRIVYIDVLNVLACFFVVVLHSTEKYFHPDTSFEWYFALMLQSVCICAVPIFLMLSGATLLEYRQRYSTAEFFKKRLLRILIPFIIWTIIYTIWKTQTGQLVILGKRDLVNRFMNNGILDIFWFFYALIPLYFCIPVLSLIAKPEHKKTMLYFCIVGVINMGILPISKNYLGIGLGGFTVPIVAGALGYLGIGWLLKHENLSKKQRCVIYAVGVLSSILIFCLTAYLTYGNKTTNRTLVTTTSLLCILLTVSVFLFVKHMNLARLQSGLPYKVLRLLSSASFGVYLIQIIVIFYVQKMPFVDRFSPWYSILGSIGIYLVCVLIVTAIKKIPLVKWIVP